MLDDQKLLKSYAEEGSDAAFGALVARYVNLVHSAALRRVNGDVELARDVAQIVFTDLARKARWLPRNVVLAGWLHRATRFAAGHVLRAERRREAREQEAALMNAIDSEPAPDWDRIRPILDTAMDGLSRVDRDALVLRFFEQQSLAKVGELLGLSEDAARKRVSRALEKLRAQLAGKGAMVTGAALIAAVSANAVQSAPAGMAVLLSKTALSGAALHAGTFFTITKIMSITKFTPCIVSAIVIAGVTTSLVVQHRGQLRQRQTEAALRSQAGQLQELTAANQQLSDQIDQMKTQAALSAPQMSELLRLRGEVGQLRRKTNELAKLAQQSERSLSSPEAPSHTAEYYQQLHQMAGGKEIDVKNLGLAFRLYANDHDNSVPTNVEALAPYFVKQKISLTGTNDIDLLYEGSLAQLGTNMDQSQLVVFRDRQTWPGPDGKPTRVYGMADGSVQTIESDDNFQAWEAAHHVAQPGSSEGETSKR